MKNKALLVLVILIAGLSFSTQAQTMKVGGGFVYGSEIENVGINVNGQYFLNDQWAIAPGFNYFFPKNFAGDLDYRWFEFNANGHYYFNVSSDAIEPYALGGLNFAFISVDYYTGFSGFGVGEVESETTTEVGLNLGGGINFNIGSNLQPFGELRLVVSEADQIVIGGGVRYILN